MDCPLEGIAVHHHITQGPANTVLLHRRIVDDSVMHPDID